MKMHNKKRGFTIVELVIVIAVIAILSAVLIPTFAGVVKKSRQSADETAVRNMNTILAADGAVEPTTLEDLYSVLAENGIDAEDYKPLQNDTFFFWDSEQNVILYADENYNVTYPADQVENTNKAAWVSLSGTIKEVKLNTVDIEDGVAKVDSAEEFIAVVNAINEEKGAVKDLEKIVLPEGDLWFMGANVSINGEKSTHQLWTELTIESVGTETVLNGIVNLGVLREGYQNGAGLTRDYYTSLIGMTKNTTVTFRNITLKDCTFASDTAVMASAFVGHAEGGSVTLANCDMENVTVKGMMKVGAYVGQLSSGAKLTINPDCSAENVKVQASVGFVGRLIGLAINTQDKNGDAPVNPVIAQQAEGRFKDTISAELVKDSRVEYITIENRGEYGLDMNVVNGELKAPAADKKEYAATVAEYGWVAVNDDETGVPYNSGVVTLKYKKVAELTF